MSSRARSTSFVAPDDEGPSLGDLVIVKDLAPLERAVDVVPAELFIAVVEALHAAHTELEQLSETEIPWSDDELERFKLAHDLQETLNRAPEEWKDRLRDVYRQAVADSLFDPPEGVTPTLLPGSLESIDEVWELLRRAALTQSGVDAALRQAEIRA